MPARVDPKKLKRQMHKIEVTVDLRGGETAGLVLLLEKKRAEDHVSARAMLEDLCQDAVDNALGSMEEGGKRLELAAAEDLVNEILKDLGMDELDFAARKAELEEEG